MKLLKAFQNQNIWPWMIIIPGVILRGWNLTNSPLWYDEAFTSLLAGLPVDRLLAATAGDVHPPLYYLLTSAMVRVFGNSVLTLRTLSWLFASLALIDFKRMVDMLPISRGAGLIALAVFAFHPAQIYYAQEARMYALFQWLVIQQVINLLSRNWSRVGIFTALALYSHNYAVFFTAVIGIAGLIRESKQPKPEYKPALLSVIIPGLVWLPWQAVMIGQMQTIQGNYWLPPISPGSVLHALFQILAGLNVFAPLTPVTFFSLMAGLFLIAFEGFLQKRWLLLSLAFGPFALAVITSLAWEPVLLFRGLLPTMPAMAALIGDVITRSNLRGRLVSIVLLAPFAVALVWQIGLSEVGSTKKVVEINAIPDWQAPIVHLDDATLILSQDTTRNWLLDANCPPEAGSLSRKTRAAIGIKSIRYEDLPPTFLFVGRLFPLSTGCHETTYRRLAGNGRPLLVDREPLQEFGIWIVNTP